MTDGDATVTPPRPLAELAATHRNDASNSWWGADLRPVSYGVWCDHCGAALQPGRGGTYLGPDDKGRCLTSPVGHHTVNGQGRG